MSWTELWRVQNFLLSSPVQLSCTGILKIFFPLGDFYLITLSDKRDVCTHVISPHKYIILIQSLESKLIWVVIGGNICEITRKTGEYYLVFSGRHWRMCGRRCEQFWQTGGPGLTNHQTRNIVSTEQSTEQSTSITTITITNITTPAHWLCETIWAWRSSYAGHKQ